MTDRTDRLPRSYLYAPGNRLDLVTKAWSGPADAVIVDLEDAVPLAGREQALAWVATWASDVESTGSELWVRVNSGERALDDAAVLAGAGARLRGLVLAKATVPDAERLTDLVTRNGADWIVSPLLETAEAVLEAPAMARIRGVDRLHLGEYDLCADVGISPGDDDHELSWARSHVVFASAAAGLAPPVGPVSVVVSDTDLFASSTLRVQRQGFFGRACIHPAQVGVVHDTFTPSADEVAAARGTIAQLNAAAGKGHGTVLDGDGRMIDEATARAARRVLRSDR